MPTVYSNTQIQQPIMKDSPQYKFFDKTSYCSIPKNFLMSSPDYIYKHTIACYQCCVGEVSCSEKNCSEFKKLETGKKLWLL